MARSTIQNQKEHYSDRRGSVRQECWMSKQKAEAAGIHNKTKFSYDINSYITATIRILIADTIKPEQATAYQVEVPTAIFLLQN